MGDDPRMEHWTQGGSALCSGNSNIPCNFSKSPASYRGSPELNARNPCASGLIRGSGSSATTHLSTQASLSWGGDTHSQPHQEKDRTFLLWIFELENKGSPRG